MNERAEKKPVYEMTHEEADEEISRLYGVMADRYNRELWGSLRLLALHDFYERELLCEELEIDPDDNMLKFRMADIRSRIDRKIEENLDYFKEYLFLETVKNRVKAVERQKTSDKDGVATFLGYVKEDYIGKYPSFEHDDMDKM